MIVLLLVQCLVEEGEICASPLYIFFYLVPEVLVFEETVPLTVLLDTQGVIKNNFLERCLFFFFGFHRRLNDKLLLPELVGISRMVQVSIPFRSVSWEMVEEDSPNERPDAFDLIGNAVKSQPLKLCKIYLPLIQDLNDVNCLLFQSH